MDQSDLFVFRAGSAPLLINVPHCGTLLPPEIAARLTPEALTLADTDWHVEKLYDFAAEYGVGLMHARYSRYVVDLNRDPDGKPLYPGADNTELCPSRAFSGNDLYLAGGIVPETEVAERRRRYWQPYHDRLAAELAAIKARHGYALLLDGHSIPSQVPRFFPGRLPDLNLGSNDGRSAAPALAAAAEAVLAQAQTLAQTQVQTLAQGFSYVHNGRFKGGYITRHYGRPAEGLHVLQLEKAEICYMDEARPNPYDAARAAPLIAVLRRLVQAMLAWRP